MFFCGIARDQAEMLDLFEQVFLLVIDEETRLARLAASAAGRVAGADRGSQEADPRRPARIPGADARPRSYSAR